MVLMSNRKDEESVVQELFTVVVLYLISNGIDFSCSNSKSSMSKYIQIKKPKVKIRVSNHWQENSESIQVISLFDMANVFHVV